MEFKVYNAPKEITIAFHNFLIKELAKGFEKQFTGLGENTEK